MSEEKPQAESSTQQTPPEESKRKRIRSFVLRQGRKTEAQKYALENYWPRYGLNLDDGFVDIREAFDNDNKTLTLEIGFGNGISLAQMAFENPTMNYIGIEVHTPGIGSLLAEVERLQLNNLRCYHHDAIEVLNKNIADNSLDRVQLFFPDPWHKRKHHKRRIVKDSFLKLISQKLNSEGVFHMATDWQDYANDAMKVLGDSEHFTNTLEANQFSPRPKERPKTKFEARGERLGHGVWDLLFKNNKS